MHIFGRNLLSISYVVVSVNPKILIYPSPTLFPRLVIISFLCLGIMK